MKYVYMLQSIQFPDRYYVGATIELKKRFADHNRGGSVHTRKFLPWKLEGYVAFSNHDKADRFEAYLKTASGRTFAKRHF
jgi:predicted GIY-YIG superfamily endonuclease